MPAHCLLLLLLLRFNAAEGPAGLLFLHLVVAVSCRCVGRVERAGHVAPVKLLRALFFLPCWLLCLPLL